MTTDRGSGRPARRFLTALLAVALGAPAFAVPATPDCCAGRMPCCPGSVAAERRDATPVERVTVLRGPVPPCCQTLAPDAAPLADTRRGIAPASAAIALVIDSGRPEVVLPCAGRVAPGSPAPCEDPPADARSARAPPAW